MNKEAVASELVKIAKELQADIRGGKKIGQFRVTSYEIPDGTVRIVMDAGDESHVVAETWVGQLGARIPEWEKVWDTCKRMIQRF